MSQTEAEIPKVFHRWPPSTGLRFRLSLSLPRCVLSPSGHTSKYAEHRLSFRLSGSRLRNHVSTYITLAPRLVDVQENTSRSEIKATPAGKMQ